MFRTSTKIRDWRYCSGSSPANIFLVDAGGAGTRSTQGRGIRVPSLRLSWACVILGFPAGGLSRTLALSPVCTLLPEYSRDKDQQQNRTQTYFTSFRQSSHTRVQGNFHPTRTCCRLVSSIRTCATVAVDQACPLPSTKDRLLVSQTLLGPYPAHDSSTPSVE